MNALLVCNHSNFSQVYQTVLTYCLVWPRDVVCVQELLGVEEEEKDSGDEEGQDHDESSEYEEYSGSEEEDTGPRLKPVFVRK